MQCVAVRGGRAHVGAQRILQELLQSRQQPRQALPVVFEACKSLIQAGYQAVELLLVLFGLEFESKGGGEGSGVLALIMQR